MQNTTQFSASVRRAEPSVSWRILRWIEFECIVVIHVVMGRLTGFLCTVRCPMLNERQRFSTSADFWVPAEVEYIHPRYFAHCQRRRTKPFRFTFYFMETNTLFLHSNIVFRISSTFFLPLFRSLFPFQFFLDFFFLNFSRNPSCTFCFDTFSRHRRRSQHTNAALLLLAVFKFQQVMKTYNCFQTLSSCSFVQFSLSRSAHLLLLSFWRAPFFPSSSSAKYSLEFVEKWSRYERRKEWTGKLEKTNMHIISTAT